MNLRICFLVRCLLWQLAQSLAAVASGREANGPRPGKLKGVKEDVKTSIRVDLRCWVLHLVRRLHARCLVHSPASQTVQQKVRVQFCKI